MWHQCLYTTVTVGCCVARTFILGPFFFEGVTSNDIQTCSISGAWYKAMLENYVITELQLRNVTNDIVLMQDAAPSNIASNIEFFNKCCNRTLVIESSCVTLQFHGNLAPPISIQWISDLEVT